MNDSVRLRKKLLSLIKELESPGVLASMTFKHMDSAQHALMKPSKNIMEWRGNGSTHVPSQVMAMRLQSISQVQSGYHTVNPNATIIPSLRKQLQ
ncbi:unnamed protein product [Sphagnum jensenii]|uniref:Uncharacterized protein n=1 Tax=Sphagnum jensenii TaxID=128206 RepID=A0ABP0V809_9BRYO